jgi:hypothetical protein
MFFLKISVYIGKKMTTTILQDVISNRRYNITKEKKQNLEYIFEITLINYLQLYGFLFYILQDHGHC